LKKQTQKPNNKHINTNLGPQQPTTNTNTATNYWKIWKITKIRVPHKASFASYEYTYWLWFL